MTAAEPWPFGQPNTIVGDWIDARSHLRCLALVGPMGSLNGYVAVPRGHRLFGLDYAELEGAEVHGGLTFSGHLRLTHEPDLWWFGFDCAHFGDVVPKLQHLEIPAFPGAVLRSPEFVGQECTRLAHELAAQ